MVAKADKTVSETKVCSGCGKDKKLDDYYYSGSYANRHTGKLALCKDCIFEYVKPDVENNYNLKLVREVLRMIDKPYIHSLWNSAIEECNKKLENGNKSGGTDYFKVYMKNIAMKDKRDLSWDDSVFLNGKKQNIIQDIEDVVSNNNLNISDADMRRYIREWGAYDDPADYLYLEEFYNSYLEAYPAKVPAQRNIYKNIAKTHLSADKAINANDIKNYKDLMDISSKLHNDAKIKPVQETGMGEDKGLHCYGLWLKDIEETEPAEFVEKRPIFEDIDKFKKYIDKWFLRPFRNTMQKQRDFNVGDEDE